MQSEDTNNTKNTNDTIVVKLSGKALGARKELAALFTAARGHRLVIVHGGGVEVDSLFKILNLRVVKKNGLRVSPKGQMPYISAALGGMCNKGLQGLALKQGLKALGMLAGDCGTLKVSPLDPELGMVGKTAPGSPEYLNWLLCHGYTPILASLCHDESGELYNVNADDAALSVAQTLGAALYYISDVPGVLDRQGQLIGSLDESRAAELIADGTISAGMEVKVRSALSAAALTGRSVYIASWKDPLLCENLFSRRPLGTEFKPGSTAVSAGEV